jgi:hypothetical protein
LGVEAGLETKAEMTALRLPRGRTLAGACLLLLAGLSPALAQFVAPGGTAERSQAFPPPPSQAKAFPSPGQGQAAPPAGQVRQFPPPGAQPQAFPSPGQAGGFTPVPPAASGPANDKVCQSFAQIGRDMEDSLKAINDAGRRKISREQACPLFKTLAGKESKALKFLETNRTRCQIPGNFIKQLKDRHAHIVKLRNTVCAAAPPAAAAGPTLSDALGGPIIADDSTAARPGRGTFDTLTGNALAR